MDTNEILSDLTAWSEATRNAEATAKYNAEGRDKTIKLADTQKIPVKDIVKATGLTRARVYQILKTA